MKHRLQLLLALAFLLLAPTLAKAEPLNVSEELAKLPALNQGIAYSLADSNFNYLSTADIVAWKGINLEGGYAGQAKNTGSKLVGVVSYDLLKLKDLGVKLPILDLVAFRPGVWLGYGKINGAALHSAEFDYGLSCSVISVKF